MKVNIVQSIEFSDEQRKALSELLGHHATRQDIKDYVWSHGADWAESLTDETTDEDEDLIGLI